MYNHMPMKYVAVHIKQVFDSVVVFLLIFFLIATGFIYNFKAFEMPIENTT